MSYIAQGLNNYTKTYLISGQAFRWAIICFSGKGALIHRGIIKWPPRSATASKKCAGYVGLQWKNRTGRSLQEKSAASHGWLYQLRRKAVCRGEEEHCLAMDFAADPFAGADFWHTVCGESLG